MWCHSYIQMFFIETEKSQSSWTVLKEKKTNGDILNTSTLKHASIIQIQILERNKIFEKISSNPIFKY